MGTFDDKRAIAGRRSRESGEFFEGMMIAASGFYEDCGLAAVDKTPEPMHIIQAHDRARGRFIACFSKKAQPDFKGVLADGTMILFDAKHTDKPKISRDVITVEQERCFERYRKLGAICFVVVSLGFEKFYRVPWQIFRDMKERFGRKYMDETDLEPYQIKYNNGIVKYLEGIELKERED